MQGCTLPSYRCVRLLTHKSTRLHAINTATALKILVQRFTYINKVAHRGSDWLPNGKIALHLPLNTANLRQGSHIPQELHRVWLGSYSLPNPRQTRPSGFYIFASTVQQF